MPVCDIYYGRFNAQVYVSRLIDSACVLINLNEHWLLELS